MARGRADWAVRFSVAAIPGVFVLDGSLWALLGLAGFPPVAMGRRDLREHAAGLTEPACVSCLCAPGGYRLSRCIVLLKERRMSVRADETQCAEEHQRTGCERGRRAGYGAPEQCGPAITGNLRVRIRRCRRSADPCR